MQHVFDALGDPMRREILGMLSGIELPAGEIVSVLRARTPISQPAVSQHLKVLRDSGLVTVRSKGRLRLYSIDEDGVATAQRWLSELVNPTSAFDNAFAALETELRRGRRTTAKQPSGRQQRRKTS